MQWRKEWFKIAKSWNDTKMKFIDSQWVWIWIKFNGKITENNYGNEKNLKSRKTKKSQIKFRTFLYFHKLAPLIPLIPNLQAISAGLFNVLHFCFCAMKNSDFIARSTQPTQLFFSLFKYEIILDQSIEVWSNN